MRTQEFTIVPRNGGKAGEGKKKKRYRDMCYNFCSYTTVSSVIISSDCGATSFPMYFIKIN